MDLISLAVAILFLMVAYLVFDKFIRDDSEESLDSKILGGVIPSGDQSESKSKDDKVTVSEVVYTQDYYPWWRSTRWWNYDGHLYQKPYYNYFRRPYYNNYWLAGKPLIIGGKRYYKRQFW